MPPLNNQDNQPAGPAPVISGNPSPQQQSWGVVISIAVIVLMIVLGAFYSWGKRIAEENSFAPSSTSQ